jgi:hypothetical protein
MKYKDCGLMMRCEWHGTKGYHFIMWAFAATASVLVDHVGQWFFM